MIIFYVVVMISSVLLVVGILMQEKTIQRIVQFLRFVGITMFLKFSAELLYGVLYNITSVVIIAVVDLAINIYVWIVVYSYYKQFEHEIILST